MGQRAKITSDLAAEVEAVDSSNLLDVIVELDGEEDEAPDIAVAKAAFERAAAPVTEVISGSGGEVLEGAWINHTLRARVPASAVTDVAAADGVSVVDVPHAIHPE